MFTRLEKFSMAMGKVKYMGVTFPTRPKEVHSTSIKSIYSYYGIYNADHEYYN